LSVLPARKRGVLVDVGAHWGSVSCLFAAHGWDVLAFEPDPTNRAVLEGRARYFPRIVIDPRGIGTGREDSQTLYKSAISTGISSLVPFHESHEPALEIELIDLASALLEHGLGEVTVLKVDTEGYDLRVLAGMNWTDFQPDVVVVEYEDAKTTHLGYSHHDLAAYLQDLGYQVIVSEWFPVRQYGGDHQWRGYHDRPSDLHDPESTGNFLGFKDHTIASAFLERFG
jgi:FkbM family methyltransferase